MATEFFTFRQKNYQDANPVAVGDPDLTIANYKNFLTGMLAGDRGGPSAKPYIIASYDEDQATATLTDNGLTGGDVAGAAINGVDATVTYASSVNNTLTLIKNKINNGGNTPNDLITKAVSAVRTMVSASAYFTLNAASGSLSPEVDGTAVTFTATEDNAADSETLAAAINASAAGVKVFAYSDGVDKTYVVAAGTNRATLTLSSSAGQVGCRINGVTVMVDFDTDDATTATALAAAINANTYLQSIVRAVNSSSGVVTVIAIAAGDQMPAIGARGTNVTVGGTTTPSTTITIATGSGTITAYVNGVAVASVTATGTDATDATALAAAINRSLFARQYVTATSSAGVVTVTSVSGIALEALGTGNTASASYLTGAGTYGGVAGNALTLTSATGVTRSAATLSGGESKLTVTATEAGVSGNWITFAAAGAGAAHVTASSTRLVSGAQTNMIVEV
jgi:hypothetical protein